MLMKNEQGETLYCVAHITNQLPLTMYFHAKDYGDANAKLLHNWQNTIFNKTTKILALGPAVGVFEKKTII